MKNFIQSFETIQYFKDREIRLWDIENCENIKIVAEQNFALGKKIVNVRDRINFGNFSNINLIMIFIVFKCAKCLRAFSIAKIHTAPFKSGKKDTPVYCVFCRMHEHSSLDEISHLDAP